MFYTSLNGTRWLYNHTDNKHRDSLIAVELDKTSADLIIMCFKCDMGFEPPTFGTSTIYKILTLTSICDLDLNLWDRFPWHMRDTLAQYQVYLWRFSKEITTPKGNWISKIEKKYHEKESPLFIKSVLSKKSSLLHILLEILLWHIFKISVSFRFTNQFFFYTCLRKNFI